MCNYEGMPTYVRTGNFCINNKWYAHDNTINRHARFCTSKCGAVSAGSKRLLQTCIREIGSKDSHGKYTCSNTTDRAGCECSARCHLLLCIGIRSICLRSNNKVMENMQHSGQKAAPRWQDHGLEVNMYLYRLYFTLNSRREVLLCFIMKLTSILLHKNL